MIRDLPERTSDLWLLVAAPTIWAIHFLASYITAAVWCAKHAAEDASLAPARLAISFYTIAALALLAALGRGGWTRHRYGESILPHDVDSPEDRHRFLGFATFLLAGLSALAVVYAALAAVLIESCR
ncbi:MAG: hypothetical protein ABR587_12455 [Candidatus Binatia bacterium]